MGIGPLEIAVFLIVLGILVFVHELGHFLAAKACGIYVDRFSLGMPPRLFGFRYGETDYCIGLLPIGGYVKMAGQEDQPLSEDERDKTYGHVPPERWFNKKPVWQRAIVLVAGPAMNLVLALGIYAFMAGYGREVPQAEIETRVGDVEKESPASIAPMYLVEDGAQLDLTGEPDATGWRTGDRIVTINDKPVKLFEDIMVAAILSGGEQARVEIHRPLEDGGTARYISPVTAQVFGEFKDARRFGIAPYTPALVRHVFPESPAQLGGVQAGDLIVEANNAPTDQPTFAIMVRELPPDTPLTLTVERAGNNVDLTVQTRREGAFKDIAFTPPLSGAMLLPDGEPLEVFEEDAATLKAMGLRTGDKIVTANGSTDLGTTLRHLAAEDPEQSVSLTVERPKLIGGGTTWTVKLTAAEALRAITGIDPQAKPVIAGISPELAEKTGLQRKDRIIEIDGAPATVARLQELEDTRIGQAISVTVERPAILFGLGQKSKTLKAELTVDSIQQIGVGFGTKTVIRREEPANILPYAFKEAWRQSARIYSVLHQLLTGGLSPKLLGGPVLIGDMVTTAYQIGFSYLLDITAAISINLAIFNLLPLPVLDGGQLVFLLIEAIRRRPVSTRVMEAVQQAGFVLIIGLLLFVTFNDVSRIVQRILP
jgi:RIP metalloprotease RseP